MFKRKIIPSILLIISVISFIAYNVYLRSDSNSSDALSKYGSRGEEVRTIQTKLKRWGYYYGNVDGIYGSQTLAAVKWFQSKNGLTVDGIAGAKTLAAMGIMSSSNTSGRKFFKCRFEFTGTISLCRSKRRVLYGTSSSSISCSK